MCTCKNAKFNLYFENFKPIADQNMENGTWCADCGTWFPDTTLTEVSGGGLVCSECLNDNYQNCSDCGEWHNNNDITELHNSDPVCAGCLDNNGYFCCDDCNEWFPESDNNYLNNLDINVCDRCVQNYSTCNDCGGWFSTDDCYFYITGHGTICENCIDNYTYCDECGDYYPQDEVFWNETEETNICESCGGGSGCSDLIKSYHYHKRLQPVFYATENEKSFLTSNPNNNLLYMGVELEIDRGNNKNDVCEYIANKTNNIYYFEYDGSLLNGFECISQPCTLNYHLQNYENYGAWLDYAINNGWRSHKTTTCGLHIHFNKSYFGSNYENCSANLIIMFSKFWNELVLFSRRTEDKLNQWAKNYCNVTTEQLPEISKGNYGRYYALNFDNRNTIEFRLFRGTLKIDSFFACLELVANMAQIAKHSTINNINQLQFSDLMTTDRLKTYWLSRQGAGAE